MYPIKSTSNLVACLECKTANDSSLYWGMAIWIEAPNHCRNYRRIISSRTWILSVSFSCSGTYAVSRGRSYVASWSFPDWVCYQELHEIAFRAKLWWVLFSMTNLLELKKKNEQFFGIVLLLVCAVSSCWMKCSSFWSQRISAFVG